MSTAMVIVVLLHLQECRRRVRDRQLCGVLVAKLFEVCLPADLHDAHDPFDVSHAAMGECGDDRVDGECVHVRQLLAEQRGKDGGAGPRSSTLAYRLSFLLAHRYCPAFRSQLRDSLLKIQEAIDADIERWGAFDWHTSDAALVDSRRRGRRMDPHVRDLVLRRGLQEGRAATVGLMAKGLAHDPAQVTRWREAEMSSYKVSAVLTFTECQTISLAYDCARIGRPAREALLVTCCAPGPTPEESRHAVLPPQAFTELPGRATSQLPCFGDRTSLGLNWVTAKMARFSSVRTVENRETPWRSPCPLRRGQNCDLCGAFEKIQGPRKYSENREHAQTCAKTVPSLRMATFDLWASIVVLRCGRCSWPKPNFERRREG